MSALDVAAGTIEARRRDTGGFVVSEVAFAGDTWLPRHEHPRACLAVVVSGAVRKSYDRATHEAGRATVITMPAGEPHADRFAPSGARIVVVESERVPAGRRAFEDWRCAALAYRVTRELSTGDAFSDLALQGLALELTAYALRSQVETRAGWLDEAAEILRERRADPPGARALAREVGVHPAHLARSFRARFGESVGSYARNARLDWAANALERTDVALARIACEAGFADQSHFTHAFARRFGVPPGRYRAAHR